MARMHLRFKVHTFLLYYTHTLGSHIFMRQIHWTLVHKGSIYFVKLYNIVSSKHRTIVRSKSFDKSTFLQKVETIDSQHFKKTFKILNRKLN
jgi:hypothetical protein